MQQILGFMMFNLDAEIFERSYQFLQVYFTCSHNQTSSEHKQADTTDTQGKAIHNHFHDLM